MRLPAPVQSPCDHVHSTLQPWELPLPRCFDVEEWLETPVKDVVQSTACRQLQLPPLEESPQPEPEQSTTPMEQLFELLEPPESVLQPESQLELVPQRPLSLLRDPSQRQPRERVQETRELRLVELSEQFQW